MQPRRFGRLHLARFSVCVLGNTSIRSHSHPTICFRRDLTNSHTGLTSSVVKQTLHNERLTASTISESGGSSVDLTPESRRMQLENEV